MKTLASPGASRRVVSICQLGAGLPNGQSRFMNTRPENPSAVTFEVNAATMDGGAVHASFDGIMTIDESQRIVMINPAALQMFGCSAEEVLGSDVSRFIPERLREAHAGHVRRFADSAVAQAQMDQRLPVVGLRANGIEFALKASISRVDADTALGRRRFFTVVLRDASAEAALRAEVDALRTRFQVGFDMAPIAIWVTENDKIVFANRACARLFGASHRNEIVGKTIYSLLHPASHQAVQEQVTRALSGDGDATLVNERIARLDGTEREVEIAIAALPDHGSTTVQMAISDITQHKEEQLRLEQSQHELRSLSASVVKAREEERRRIARELHDELGQRLSALKMDLSSLGHDVHRSAFEGRISTMIKMLDDTVASVRRIAADLRPMMLDDLGLNAAVEWLARESSKRMGIEVTVRHGDTDPRLDSHASTAVYRIVQEALNNVTRHARATDARIEMWQLADELVLTVQDNGIGFPLSQARNDDSFGLIGIRERAYLLGGSLEIANPPGGGARLTVRLPLASPRERTLQKTDR
jgi:PAS domain S-box-containing protein